MSRRRKKGTQRKKLRPQELERKLLKQFLINPKKRFNSKQLIKKLKLINNRDSVDYALEKLGKQNKLISISEGRYKLNKSFKGDFIDGLGTGGRSKKKLFTGKVDMTRSGSAYIIIPEIEEDVFVSAKNLRGALDGDIVKILASLKSGKHKAAGKVVEIIERSQAKFIGKLYKFPNEAFVEVNHKGIMFQVDVRLHEVEEIAQGNSVKLDISSWGKNDTKRLYQGKNVIDLGSSVNNDVVMTEILYNNGFAQEFPKEIEEEAKRLSMEITEETLAERRDFRDTFTITIDPETAKDFDDAISFKKLDKGDFEIGVHIADVTHYLKEGSALDDEAYERATSVYLVDRVAPMLPEMLSNDLCSLNPKEDKFCFSAVFIFSKDFAIKDRWFGRTIIHSDRRFTYEEAQERIVTGKGDFADEIQFLDKVSKHLRSKRFHSGSIAFQSEELRFKLDEDGKPIEVYVKESFDAHKLIEDFMLLANKEVAIFINKKAKGKEIPFVYRIHDEPDPEKLADFAAFAKEMGIHMKLDTPQQIADSFNDLAKQAEENDPLKILEPLAIRTMAKAEYSSNNIGHYGLGFEHYAHFTSPIRRYADVLVHRILDANLKNTYRTDKDKLEAKCKHISLQERKAVTAERESIKYKQVEWAKEHVGQEFHAYISGMIDRGLFVTLENSLVEGMVGFDQLNDHFILNGRLSAKGKKSGTVYKMGDKVRVKISSADLEKRQIELEYIDLN